VKNPVAESRAAVVAEQQGHAAIASADPRISRRVGMWVVNLGLPTQRGASGIAAGLTQMRSCLRIEVMALGLRQQCPRAAETAFRHEKIRPRDGTHG
jgi:hypothetical protein